MATLALLAVVPAASASQQVVDFFGGDGTEGGLFSRTPAGVAVNNSGAGPADQGDVYATDGGVFGNGARGNRIERFGRDDNGTPADPSDDTFHFISAWGAGVETEGTDYEVCTVASSCQAAAGIGGNGTLAGNGALSKPSGIAVDQDTGLVFVSDNGPRNDLPGPNFRVNVYDGDGTFLRSFGWDVVESGPDDNGTGYEICKAGLDVCKAGLPGAGVGQVGTTAQGIAVSQPDGNPATGTVFLADSANRRVNTYDLDGSSPSSFGTAADFASNQPEQLAVDSRGIVYASDSTNADQIERYDSQNANGGGVGFLAPVAAGVNEVQQVTIAATAGTFRLSFEGHTSADLPFDASVSQIKAALEALPSIGPGNVQCCSFGGPGDATGSTPYKFTFNNALGARDVPQLEAPDGSTPLSGGAGASVATTTPGQAGLIRNATSGLAVDPDSDGAGPDTDVLYVLRSNFYSVVQQLGPVNSPGLTAPPTAIDDTHATAPILGNGDALTIDQSTGRLYAGANQLSSGFGAGPGVYVLGDSGPPPTATLDSLSGKTSHSVLAHVTIDPNGPPATSYHLEYSTDGVNWSSAASVVLGQQNTPQAIDVLLDPPPAGLAPNTLYHVRLVAGRKLTAPVITPDLTFTTDPGAPLVETTGSPIRGTDNAQLQGRVGPNGSPTSFHFEYGAQGPCDANPCTSTDPQPAGSGDLTELVAESIEGLQPATTYHYRVVADNGAPGSPVAGADMTVTTRTSNAPLSHGHFPGPTGSDRAWELVSLPDSSGNPTLGSLGLSDDGNRALYQVAGGTPVSEAGSIAGIYLAERPPGAHPQSGWQTRLITPPRSDLIAPGWFGGTGSGDLSSFVATNGEPLNDHRAIWHLASDGQPSKLFEAILPQKISLVGGGYFGVSADGGTTVAQLEGGSLDADYPAATATGNLYDISSGSPRLTSLLPGNVVAACGVGGSGETALPAKRTHWVSVDGSLVFFASKGKGPCASSSSQLYMREMDAAQTKLVSSPPLSGPSCDASLVRAIDGAAFFSTAARLAADDVAPASCATGSSAGNDVYRYDIGDGSLKCVTCIASVDANVLGSGPMGIAVSPDGSRVYFQAVTRLLAGAPADGAPAVYRANVSTDELAYVAPLGPSQSIGYLGSASLSPDGTEIFFRTNVPGVNPLGGSDNGGTSQIYRYDDEDRGLTCVSCPQDGSVPVASVSSLLGGSGEPNLESLSEGGIFTFSTPTPLVGADQNAPAPGVDPKAGTDIYEWRDGRQLLVTDGLTDWPAETVPQPVGISPSGRDILFSAPVQYTPDAIDSYLRIYDARIGGGIDFPAAPRPCPLEVCQGTPKGAPEEQEPGSGNFSGSGNPTRPASKPKARRCAKGTRKVRRNGKARCVKHGAKRNAKHDRRAAR